MVSHAEPDLQSTLRGCIVALEWLWSGHCRPASRLLHALLLFPFQLHCRCSALLSSVVTPLPANTMFLNARRPSCTLVYDLRRLPHVCGFMCCPAESLDRQKLAFHTTRPSDYPTPYDLLLRNNVQFSAVEKRGSRLTTLMVRLRVCCAGMCCAGMCQGILWCVLLLGVDCV
jgi:hypothetical protein